MTPRFQLGRQACGLSPTASAAGGFSQCSQRGSRGKPPSAGLANSRPPWDAAGARARRCCFPGGAEGAAGDRATCHRVTLTPWDPQIAPLPSSIHFSSATLFLGIFGSCCPSSSCSPPFIPLSQWPFPGSGLGCRSAHSLESHLYPSALQFPARPLVPCTLPLSWQEAACRITNTDLASRLSPLTQPLTILGHCW